ncbi:NmrA family NAD(P)-binding protein [Pectobacterium sp. CHL-2024]|uniref:NmrA family NAD(P)-binding protein n=1 Tax=Pectobacterium sp. CHL-2024 TaxID=3377079 RepID=UPI003807743D
MMGTRVLVLGATGSVGSKVVAEFDKNSDGVEVILSSSRPEITKKWLDEGRRAVTLDLNAPETYTSALSNIDRVFLLTGYTADMLYQSKKFVDAAVEAGVSHIVHLGVFSSRSDIQPHFVWHDLIETYIKASGIASTNLHPNVITDTVLVRHPSVKETGSVMAYPGDVPVGWVCTADIAAVAAATLREGPQKHGGQDYYLSVEVLRGTEVADILSRHFGKEIRYEPIKPEDQRSYLSTIEDAGTRYYMQSAAITMELAAEGKLGYQAVVRDDVQKVLGRPGKKMEEWVRQNLM